MVEGPGCTLNGEKIRARVQKGQKVVEISGSASHGGASGSFFQCFSGCEYTGVQTLGKELFMYFGVRALRRRNVCHLDWLSGIEWDGRTHMQLVCVSSATKPLSVQVRMRQLLGPDPDHSPSVIDLCCKRLRGLHFGMNGSMRINTPESIDFRRNPASLVIRLTKDRLCFFSTTVEIRLSEDCKEKVQHMASLDVCSQNFSMPRAVEVVCKESGRIVCDVLLDQSVLPGVGNIIKNEALFLSALNPAVKVNQLRTEHVRHLVKMTRDFTLLFYQCRKTGSALNKHYKVYNRTTCGHCSGAITVCRLGDDKRMTYFCKRCQTEDPAEIDVNKTPGLNTLLRWTDQTPPDGFDRISKKEEEEWSCDLCTLINQPVRKFCEACMNPQPQQHAEAAKDSSFSSNFINYPHNSFSKPQQEVKLNWRAAFGNTTLIVNDLSCKPATSLSCTSIQKNNPLIERNASFGGQPTISKRAAPGFPSIPSKRRKMEINPTGGVTHNNTRQSSCSGPTSVPTTPCCTSHDCPCALKVVTKDGVNKGRQFYSCSLPGGSQCNFFEWADLHFPLCHHGKRTLMRTVLKLGPNNSRQFYVCPLHQGKQCDFFQWVKNGL